MRALLRDFACEREPVEGAEIRLEGLRDDKFVTLVDGRTDRDGAFTWDVGKRAEAEIKRVVVAKGLDALVLEPANGPPEYARDNWTKPEEPWLAWTVNPGVVRATPPQTLCHIFTERPIYRPEEPVQIKGYVRSYQFGALSYAKGAARLSSRVPAARNGAFRDH